MPPLKEPVKVFIIQQLAMYKQPQEVVDLVKENFKIETTRQNVFNYHPDQGKVSKKLKVIFDTTRKQFLETVSAIPIANQAFRIQELQQLLNNQKKKGDRVNTVLVMDILEQAAKEVGGMFTNQRQITGKDGKPLIDNTEIAIAVFNELINQENWKQPDALKFVTDRYKVPESDLVSEANN